MDPRSAPTLEDALATGEHQVVLETLHARSAEVIRRLDLDILEKVASLVAPDGGPLPAAVAWRMGFIHHRSGRFADALACFERPGLPGDSPTDLAHLNAAHASSLWARGDAEASRDKADLALALALEADDAGARAAAWTAQALVFALEGDRNANRHAYGQAIAAATEADDRPALVRLYTNMGSLENEEGNFAIALDHLDTAIQLAEQDDDMSPVSGALAHYNSAESLLALGRVDEALAELRHTQLAYRESGSPLLGLAMFGIGEANRLRGHATQASAAYREAVELVAANGNAQVLVPALAGLARTCIAEDPEEAHRLVDRAVAEPAALGRVAARLAAGWIALAEADSATAGLLAREAIQEAGRRHHRRGLAEALELLALAEPDQQPGARLAEAAAIWGEIGSPIDLATNRLVAARLNADPAEEARSRRALESWGVLADDARIAGPLHIVAQRDAELISVRALGSFVVLRGGRPVSSSSWTSRQSRDILKILAGRRGRPVTRDALCDHLWPDDVDTGSRLSVVLSTLRGVLDPDRRHPTDRYVIADRGSVRLNLDTVEIDLQVFEAAARVALRAATSADPGAIELLEHAASLYTGDYLEDDPYDVWSADVREELHTTAREVRRTLASVLTRTAHADRAIPWLVGLVGDDPYDEDAYRRLVGVLSRARRHGEARRWYRSYAAHMTELATEPASLQELLAG